jgi:anti-anti-sigma regulatory factor
MGGFKSVTTGPGELTLGGSLTVDNAPGIRAKLLEVLENWDSLALSVEDDADVDVSLLQILCAAHQTSVKKKKAFLVAGVGKNLAAAADSAGYARQKGGGSESGGRYVWVRGKDE